MKLVASRLVLWWAAPASVLSLFLPGPYGPGLAAASALAAGVSISLRGRWRLRERVIAAQPPAVFDAAALDELARDVDRACRDVSDLDAALIGVADRLLHEIGAVGLVAGRVDGRGQAWPMGQRPGGRPARMDGALAEAMDRGGPAGSVRTGFALVVRRGAHNVAWLAFRRAELPLDDVALLRLLGVAHDALSAVALRDATFDAEPGDSRVDPLRPPFAPASVATGHEARAHAFPAFDASVLARVDALDPQGRHRLKLRVVQTFLRVAETSLPQLASACADRDAAAVTQLAKRLGSSAGSVGAIKLAGLCAEMQSMKCDACWEELRLRLDGLAEEVGDVRAALRTQEGDGA